MLIKLFRSIFGLIIGNIPEDKRREFWVRFDSLLVDVAKAAAEGAVQGVTKK